RQDDGPHDVARLVTDRKRLRLERELATFGFQPELARLARGALQPARVGAGEEARAGSAEQRPGLHREQFLDAVIGVHHLALSIERDDRLLERVQDLLWPGKRSSRDVGLERAARGLASHGVSFACGWAKCRARA